MRLPVGMPNRAKGANMKAMSLRPTDSAPWWHHDFAACVSTTDSEIELDRAATLLSAHRSEFVARQTDVKVTLDALDMLRERCEAATFEAWHRLLWVEVGFSGNGIDYHDVRNSFLPDVLDRRIGIPISLSVVAIEVGHRLGLPVFGVGMPGHFLLGFGSPTDDTSNTALRYIDPFNGGSVLDFDGARARFESMFGVDQEFSAEYLRPTATAGILVRMCANLKQNYARERDIPGLRDIMRLRTCLPDASITEGRELVRLLHASGTPTDALQVCDQLEACHPEARGIIDHERDRIIAQFN